MKTIDNVIEEIMANSDKKEFKLDITGLNPVDRATIIDGLECEGFLVDTYHGSDYLEVHK